MKLPCKNENIKRWRNCKNEKRKKEKDEREREL